MTTAATTTALRRTVPYLRAGDDAAPALHVDTVALRPRAAPGPEAAALVATSIDLSGVAAAFPGDVAASLVEDAYEVALEHVFSHPLWEDLRTGADSRLILAYLVETRHYLQAAPSRMSPGAAGAWRDDRTTELLAEHLVEEADHARFFEDALASLGCPRGAVGAARPGPVTVEWVTLMRSLARRDPLIAAVCSGLMEHSARARDVVAGWHRMLVERGLLPQAAVDAIYAHIELDIALDHGSNWRDVLDSERYVTARRLADALNAVASVAEMIYRWCSSLRTSSSGDLVALMAALDDGDLPPREAAIDRAFDGAPVWPAAVLHAVTHEHASTDAGRAIALAYHFDGLLDRAPAAREGILGAARDFHAAVAARLPEQVAGAGDLLAEVRSWHRGIDGHELWAAMAEPGSDALVAGWILENYHYLKASSSHVSNAVAACPDETLRAELLHHLEEETEHGDLLEKGLAAYGLPVPLHRARPLPTTTAFVGALVGLARHDWVAYCLAIAFLQDSLRPSDPRHGRFYEAVLAAAPRAAPLVDAMRRHDSIDEQLGHQDDVRKLLAALADRHPPGAATLRSAASVAGLTWSFLDGIRESYGAGELALAGRVGWHGY